MGTKKKCVITGFGSLGGGSWYKEVKKHPDWELIGVVDTNTELLENLDNYGIDEDHAYMSIDDAVKFGDEKPDLNIIATPIYTHHVLCKETMSYDINVICEKNMASTVSQGKQMAQLAIDKPELSTAVGTQYRYFPKYWTAHKFFNDPNNSLGKLAFMRWSSGGNWGEKRSGWRRWLPEVYLEDMCTHWFDLMRYITGLDIVQVRCDTFIPRYSEWQGSSTVFVNVALAHPDDYKHRHNWVWAQLYGDWQARGKGANAFDFHCEKGNAKLGEGWLELEIFKDVEGRKSEEDGFLAVDAGSIEGLDVPFTGQGIILEMMSRSIESKGKNQPGTNFQEAFKSFCGSMAAIKSSHSGKAIYVPDMWEGLLE
jgi:predicted dehydrogenase